MASTVGYLAKGLTTHEITYPDTLSPEEDDTIDIYINPNGGTLILRDENGINVFNTTAVLTLYAESFSSNTNITMQLYATASKSGYTLGGWQTDTNNYATFSQLIHNTAGPSGTITSLSQKHIAIKAKWNESGGGGTTITNCTAPTTYKVNDTAGNITVTAGSTVTYSWANAAGGTNNSIMGYWVNVQVNNVYDGNLSHWVSTTSTSGSTTINTTGLGGKTIKVAVKTVGTQGEAYQSDFTPYRTITVSTTRPKYTITLDTNGGTLPSGVSSTIEDYHGSQVTLPVPTRKGYMFKGWYMEYDSTKANATPYGDQYTYAGAITLSCSTYKADYTTADPNNKSTIAIISMSEQCGFAFEISGDGKYVQFAVATGNSAWEYVQYSTSNVSPGWHEWCCIFSGSEKKVYLYMDGKNVASASTTKATIGWVPYWGSSYGQTLTMNMYAGGEYGPESTGQLEWANFTGYIGNVLITNTAANRRVDYTKAIMPQKNVTMKARWDKVAYAYVGGVW